MTKAVQRTAQRERQCPWCGRTFEASVGPGRPRRYCRQGCRQQAFIARKLAAAHGLGDNDVVVPRQRLEEFQGHLYCLQAALEDVDRDLEKDSDPAEIRRALEWLLENTEPFRSFWIEPRTLDV
jgi:hypothetical protein